MSEFNSSATIDNNAQFINSLDSLTVNDIVPPGRKKHKKKSLSFSKFSRILVLFLCFAVFLYCISELTTIMNDYQRGDDLYDEIVKGYYSALLDVIPGNVNQMIISGIDMPMASFFEIKENGPQIYDPPNNVINRVTSSAKFIKLRAWLEELRDTQNKDTYGHIYIPNSKINYPMVQCEDNDYYLTHAYTGAGSLPYALHNVSTEYIAFDASLDGQTVDLAGCTTYNGEKHVVGNGYTETIISGGINCTSKTTFSNLGMSGVIVSSGTLTLGDVYIPNGATVAVSGGGLAVEKVVGDGSGVIDLGGTNVSCYTTPLYASGCEFKNGRATLAANGAGIFLYYASGTFSDCVFENNENTTSNGFGGAVYGNNRAIFSNCVFSSNTCTRVEAAGALCVPCDAYNCVFKDNSGALLIITGQTYSLTNCELGSGQNIQFYYSESLGAGTNE